MGKSILFVDDEQQIIRALRRLFIHSEYDMFFANSAEDALQILEQNVVDLLVTDIKMPKMDGFELLEEAKTKYPLMLRVALSGYTDNKKIYSAIENNIVKLYLYKPWDNNEIVEIINKMFELEDVLKDKKLLNLINNLDKLPTVSSLYTSLCKLIEEDASMDVISKKIEEDPSISSKILRVANSAFYGAKTGSISQAIMYIGLINVKNIVLTNGIFDSSRNNTDHYERLWKHVNLSNKIMHLLYQKCIFKKIPNIYASAGLLHDIGKIILLDSFSKEYDEILMDIKESSASIHELELEKIGIDHQKIGGYLLNWWELPFPIIESAMYHHDPLNKSIINKELVQIVHIADYYSWQIIDAERNNGVLNLDVLKELSIDIELVEKVIAENVKE
ncbi:response regulator [Helicovermis profundi]|uniref:Stage 0 sporulation protein A homolog n=1 Tax=Helicovermis profundi TaxID=3065157 RepID=A0AAU9E5U2_9FIRM|nr:response regulator [Clostridia bacterium S502]